MAADSTRFTKAFTDLIGLEGGYVNHPADKGGETNFGISRRSYPNENIKALTLTRAMEIYKSDFWDKLQLDNVPIFMLQTELFEQAVNMGVDRAARHLQMALKMLGGTVFIDGVVGVQTVKALTDVMPQHTMNIYKILNGLQFAFYLNLVTHDKTQGVFLVGWMKRVNFEWNKTVTV